MDKYGPSSMGCIVLETLKPCWLIPTTNLAFCVHTGPGAWVVPISIIPLISVELHQFAPAEQLVQHSLPA